MSAEIKGILKSDGIELLGSGLDKVTRIHFRPHGVMGDDVSSPDPQETDAEVASNPAYSQNPTRIFLSATDLQTFWDNEGMFDWNSWYKLALYYNDAQNVEQVYIPDGFVSVFDDGGVINPALGSISLVTYSLDGQGNPVATPAPAPDGVTTEITTGFLEAWGNQWFLLTPSVAGSWTPFTTVRLSTAGDPDTILTGNLLTVHLADGSIMISAVDILSVLAETAGPPNPEEKFCLVIMEQGQPGTTVITRDFGIGPILGHGVNAHTMPVIREIGVIGQPAITQWDQTAIPTDIGFLEGLNLELTTTLSFFDPGTSPDPISIGSIPFTVATPQDGYPSRIEFSFADLNVVNPALFDTFWTQLQAHLYIRVQNAGGQYDTYGITQFTPGGEG